MLWLSRLQAPEYNPDLEDTFRSSLKCIVQDTNHDICISIRSQIFRVMMEYPCETDIDVACLHLVKYCNDVELCNYEADLATVPKYWMDVVATVEYIYG